MSEVHKALLAVQAEVGKLPKSADNPFFKSKYTPLDKIVEIVGPLLSKNGLTWSALPSQVNGVPMLNYQLTHAETGGSIHGSMPLFLPKEDPQGQGSAITYARRYALCAVLNLVADEDDDGNKASGNAKKPAMKKPEVPSRFSDELRQVKMKSNELKFFIKTDRMKDHDTVDGLTGDDFVEYLDSLSSSEQKRLLAFAKGELES